MHSTLRRTLFVLLSLGLFVLLSLTALEAVQHAPEGPLAAIRARAQSAESYRIGAKIDQVLTPRPLPGTIGERDTRVCLQLDGTVEGAGKARYMLRGDGPGMETSITLVQQDGGWLLEQDGEHQPVDAPPGTATPHTH